MKNIINTLAVFTLLMGCSSAANRKPYSVQFNMDLLLSWDEAAKDLTTAKREVVYEFKKNGKTLIYLQAGHGTDKKAKTFTAIDWVYKNSKPQVAIVEGFAAQLGLSPSTISEQMSEGINGDFYPDGEVSYMVIKANENYIPFIGGEPTLQESLQHILNAGYTENDFLGFLFVRVIPQKIRANEINSSNIKKVFVKYITSQSKALNVKNPMTFEDFKNWYWKSQGRIFQFDKLGNGETAPLSAGTMLTQKISMIEVMTREKLIISTIEKMLNQYETVFIAYGSSHYRLEHKVFKGFFGEPRLTESY